MSVFGDSQVRGLFVGSIDQTDDTLDGLANGEVGAYNAANGLATIAGEPFIIVGFQNGKKRTIGPIDPDKVLSYGEKTLEIWVKDHRVKYEGTVETNDAFEITLYLDEYGAANGIDAWPITAGYVAEDSDTLVQVVDGLAANLNKALIKEGIPAFANNYGITASNDGASSVLLIKVGRGDFKLGKFNGKIMDARALGRVYKRGATGSLKATTQEVIRMGPIPNGVEIANLEWFMEGNFGDVYRGSGYPNNFETEYNTNPSADYKLYELVYYSERIGAPGDKQRQMVTIANSDATTGVDNIATAIETAIV